MEWIKVTDQPLPLDTPILVYYTATNGPIGDQKLVSGMTVCEVYQNSSSSRVPDFRWLNVVGVYGWDYEDEFDVSDITHWMQLPDPPREDTATGPTTGES